MGEVVELDVAMKCPEHRVVVVVELVAMQRPAPLRQRLLKD
jgi:hypothetical protein